MTEKTRSDNEKRGVSEHGIIFVSGEITGATAESVCKEIIEFNLQGEVERIQMIVNSCGGSCTDGFAIIDIMEWSRIPVYTTGIGMIASMGLLIFMTGQAGRRVITPRTSILSHRFAGMTLGNHSQLLAGRKEQDLLHDRIIDHYLRYSKIKDRVELESYLLRDVDTWLSGEEAVRFGVADIIEPLSNNRVAA